MDTSNRIILIEEIHTPPRWSRLPQKAAPCPELLVKAALELAQSTGIMPVVRQVELGELLRADEAFLSNSILEIMPLTRLDGKSIGSGKPGPLTQRLMSTYKELVDKEA